MRTDAVLALRNKISHYPKRDLILSHITPVLEEHDSLQARVEEFTYNDGRSQLLLSIFGVLPITIQFRNQQNTYNCPLSIFLPLNYPAEPPVILILPRSGMVLKSPKSPRVEGRLEVDRDGNVACRYLSDWARKGEGSSLVQLIQILKQEFSQNYPLVSVSTNPAPSPSTSPAPSSRSPPPRPPPPPGPNSSYRDQRPPLSPTNGNGSSYPQYQQYRPPQNPPPQKPTEPQYYSPPIQNRPIPPQQPQQFYQSPSNRAQSYPPPTPSNQIPPNQLSRPIAKATLPNLLDFDDLSISSAAPPDPTLLALRNALHSKLTLALNQIHSTTTAQLSSLNLLTQDLEKGPEAIEDEMNRLTIVKDVCENVGGGYSGLINQGKQRREEYSRKLGSEGVGVDELICSISIVHNQLLDLIAEDLALEDTIYQLGRALQTEAAELDLDKFLKRVRGLAMKQFEKRTLINQIERGM